MIEQLKKYKKAWGEFVEWMVIKDGDKTSDKMVMEEVLDDWWDDTFLRGTIISFLIEFLDSKGIYVGTYSIWGYTNHKGKLGGFLIEFANSY